MATCKRTGCKERAVAVVLTQGEHQNNPERLEDWCRPHHADERRQAGRTASFELLKNGITIMDIDGSEKRHRGDRVEWDLDEVNADVNVDAGLVKPLDSPDLAAALADEAEALKARLAAVTAQQKDAEKAAKAESAEQAKAESKG